MGATSPPPTHHHSALQTLLQTHPPPPTSPHPPDLHNLALQTAHNLHHQHQWTSLHLHLHAGSSSAPPGPRTPLPRPLISGIPPRRLYVHPDEQIETLQRQKDAGGSGMPTLAPEREWVLPSHLRETWSLRAFGETFDALEAVPAVEGAERLFGGEGGAEEEEEEGEEGERSPSRWRVTLPKRVLLATVDDDSTVVYYIVHDGVVKPRQN